MIKEVVYEYKEWILKAIQKVPSKNSFDFVSGGVIPFLGISYPMNLIVNEKMKNVKFSLKDKVFTVQYNDTCSSYEDFIEGLKLIL